VCWLRSTSVADEPSPRATSADVSVHSSTSDETDGHYGHPFINTKDGLNVAVFRKGQGWGARLVDRRTGYINASNKSYASEAAAKLAAFDAIERYRERYPDRPTPPAGRRWREGDKTC
jgi:hypothetical protein